MVMPTYRSAERGRQQPYLVRKLRADLAPTSVMPRNRPRKGTGDEEVAKTFQTYYR